MAPVGGSAQLGVFYTHWSLNDELVMGRHMDRCTASKGIRRLPKACRRLLER